MGSINKNFASILIIIMAISSLSLIMVRPASAQSIPTPSVPEFTIKYVDNSYDIPPTYGVDQYTGQNIIIKAGQHVDSRTIEFTIKNQSFKPYSDTNGNHITLYYDFRFKGAYGNDWSYYPDTSHTYGRYTGFFPDTSASNSDYTVIMISLPTLTSYPAGTPEIPTGAKVDFQVQAIMGNISIESTGMVAGGFYGFTGERSDWSNTQTITITNGATSTIISASASSNPTPSPITTSTTTPNIPELPILVVLPLFLAMFLIAIKFLERKHPSKGL